MQDMQSENAVIELNRAHLWQIALFSLNNTSTNLYLAMMGYVSYYANGIAGLSVVVISFILTGMRIFDGVTDPVIGYVIDKTNGRFGKFRPFMISGYVLLAGSLFRRGNTGNPLGMGEGCAGRTPLSKDGAAPNPSGGICGLSSEAACPGGKRPRRRGPRLQKPAEARECGFAFPGAALRPARRRRP